MSPSADTHALLLLTAPPLPAERQPGDRLTGRDCARLLSHLRELQRRPADLLGPEADELVERCHPLVDRARLRGLLGRGASLARALERWAARAIWVVSRLDPGYPRRLEARLRDRAPALLFGRGNGALLQGPALAIVGSRDAGSDALDYSGAAGRLAARAGRLVLSGGARGVDQAAMQGACAEGGPVAGVLASGLQEGPLPAPQGRALAEGRLVLLSAQAPGAPFQVGHAMQRNRLIYALSEAALVVEAEPGRGGTWAGASEQLDRLRFVPVYVRSGSPSRGLAGLVEKGARPWPDPPDPGGLLSLLDTRPPQQATLPLFEGPPHRR